MRTHHQAVLGRVPAWQRQRAVVLLAWLAAACGNQEPIFTATPPHNIDTANAPGAGAPNSGDATANIDRSGPAASTAPSEQSSAGGTIGTLPNSTSPVTPPDSVATTPAPTPPASPAPPVATASTPDPAAPAPAAPDTPAAPAAPTPVADVPVIPPGCNPSSGATQAQIKSSTITATSITIVYRLYRTDCAGVLLPLTVDTILFDLNANVSAFTALDYSIVPDMPLSPNDGQSGAMTDIVGSDLFGDVGSGYAHWQTNAPVTVLSGNNAVDLTISTSFTAARNTDGLHTYLAFGSASAVTVVVPMN